MGRRIFSVLTFFGVMVFGQASFAAYMQHVSVAYASALSADGTTVVGQTSAGEAFRWTQADGLEDLGILPGNDHSTAYWVSADGSAIMGDSFGGAAARETFRWTQSEGMVGTGTATEVYAISNDGSTAIVDDELGGGPGMALWTQSGGVGDSICSGCRFGAASADLSVVVGASDCCSPPNWGMTGFRWTQDTGVVWAPDFGVGVEGWQESWIQAVSADGTAMAGWRLHANTASGLFRWTESEGLSWLELGQIGPFDYETDGFSGCGDLDVTVTGITNDASMVVGYCNEAGDPFIKGLIEGAFIWTEALGDVVPLRDYLIDLGLDLTGVPPDLEPHISADGQTLLLVDYGNGFWIADLSTVPEPSTGVLLGVGLLALAVRKKKH